MVTTTSILTAKLAEFGTFVENELMFAVAPRAGPARVASAVLVLVAAFLYQPAASHIAYSSLAAHTAVQTSRYVGL